MKVAPSSGKWGRSEDQPEPEAEPMSGLSPRRRHWEEGGGGRKRTPRSGHGISGLRVAQTVWRPDQSHKRSSQRLLPAWTVRSRARVNRGGKERKGHVEEPGVGRSPK